MGSEVELDVRVWGLRARIRKGAGRCLMPHVQAWARPPMVIKESGPEAEIDGLARAARRMYAHVGNSAFWVSSRSTPRTPLEQFALDVFWFHVGRLGWKPEAIARLGRAAGAEF